MKNEASSKRVYAVIPFAMTISLFFLWGMAHNLNDILIAQFKRAFSLSNAQASLVQSAFYCAYLVMPLPVSIVMNKLGYRNAVLCGLAAYGVGAMLFWPAAAVHQYNAFLAVLFIIACGIVFLETSGMAMIAALGPSRSYEWRINLASAFNPVGSIAGILIGRQFIFPSVELTPVERTLLSPMQAASYSAIQANAVRWPYLAIGICVILWAVAIKMTPYPQAVDERRVNASFKGELAKLCKAPHFLYGVLVQLLYVGSQIACWSFLILYSKAQLPGITDRRAATYLIYSLCAFIAGRFTTTICLRWFTLAKICAVAASASVALCIVAAVVGGELGVSLDERQALGAILLELLGSLAAPQVDTALGRAAAQDHHRHQSRSEPPAHARPQPALARQGHHVIGPGFTMPEPGGRGKAGSGDGAPPARCCRRCRRAGR